jgi:hypothetical protein
MMAFCFSTAAMAATQVKLNKQSQKEIENIFQQVEFVLNKSFSAKELTNQELIRFGIHKSAFVDRNIALKAGRKPVREGYFLIPAEYVEAAVKKHFNRTVKHESVGDLKYSRGFYEVPGYTGDTGELNEVKFIKAETSDGRSITVNVGVYDVDSRKLLKKESAVFQRVSEKGVIHFVMLEFKL